MLLGNMKMKIKDAVVYLTFPDLEKFNFIKHAFSTRIGGISDNEFASMNLGFNRGDSKENVLKNYKRFCNAIGVNINDLVASSQEHGTSIRIVDESNRGDGIFYQNKIKNSDGLLTNVSDVALVTYYADCTPIYFLDPIKKVVGLAHAGWRGTVDCIGAKMIEKMKENYFCNESDIICAIGPSIGKCCFEVDEPVADKFKSIYLTYDKEEFVKKISNDKFLVDLQKANRQILIKSKVEEKNIYLADVCTKCNYNILFSHRQTSGKRGTMVAIIKIEKRNNNDEQ